MAAQSYRDGFVSNTGTLLAQGATVESLAVGQVGIADAKSYTGVTSPTYAKNKALILVQGTPDLGDLPLLSGVPNENDYSKLIKGKFLTGFRGKKAVRPRNEVWTVGWSGDNADTDTLFAKPGEVKHLYIKLTGGPIDKLFSKQGITRQFSVKSGAVDDCGEPCTDVDCQDLVDQLTKAINSDPLIGAQGSQKNRLIKASSIVDCETPASVTTDTDYVFVMTVCDNGDDVSLGLVQAQYPDDVVKRIGRSGSDSTYQIISDTNVEPTAYSNNGITVIPDCDSCPSGYTLTAAGFAYQVQRSDAGDAGALTSVKSDYSITGSEVGIRSNYEFGSSTYILISTTALTVSGVDILTFLGESRSFCVLTTPSTVDWNANGTLTKFGKKFRLTIADDVCGTSRFADVQAAFSDLTVTEVDASGDCVHTFETTVFSQAVEEGCSLDTLVFEKPQAFEGIEWVEVAGTYGTTCKCGVRIEVAFVNRITNECTFDKFPYEAETVHVQISSFDPDYNASPDELQWAVKKIQSYQHPAGFGAHVRKQEQDFLSYRLKERSHDPVVREIEGYSFQAVPDRYYDEYVLEFDFKYKVGGWAQEYTDAYSFSVYFPEGNGKNFENAINAYIASAAIQIDPVKL